MAEESKETQAAAGEETVFGDLLSMIRLDDDSQTEKIATAVNYFVKEIAQQEEKPEKIGRQLIDDMISTFDKKLSDQVSEIMHHEKFQELESAWRGLWYVVDNTNFNAKITIELLNLSKDDLVEDLEEGPLSSGLFHHTYHQEYDQAGGEPCGAIIGNYSFNKSQADMDLLNKVSSVAAASHCPFIGAISHQFLGLDSSTSLHKIKKVSDLLGQDEYVKWRAFRDSEDSRYVGLTFPRFLLRAPYDPTENPGSKEFDFVENVTGQDHERYLWGNASFAFATRLTQSFAKNGWCVNIRGPQSGGIVEDLPLHLYEAEGDRKQKIPTEVIISDSRELELAEAGFMPLTFYKGRDYACFFSAQSAQRPKRYTTPEATANAKLSANLPYLFLACRLSHYLKVIQRENIGSLKEGRDLEVELNDWIKRLVTDMPGAGPELKAKRPLKQAQIHVSDIAESPGWYNVEMNIRPHFQLEGMDMSLSLVSKMPLEKK